MTDRIRQISKPAYNEEDGHWYNRDRILVPNGASSYKIAEENVYRSYGPEPLVGLPQPWTQNIDSYLRSKSGQGLAGALGAILNPVTSPIGLGLSLLNYSNYFNALSDVNRGLKGGGDPLAGTVYDVEYNKWPGTDKPWDQSTRWPYSVDPAPGIVPHGYPAPLRSSPGPFVAPDPFAPDGAAQGANLNLRGEEGHPADAEPSLFSLVPAAPPAANPPRNSPDSVASGFGDFGLLSGLWPGSR